MPLDPSKISPAELVRLLNSTSMGQVIDDRTLHKHRERAGYTIGKEKTLNLVAYAAWLVKELENDPTSTPITTAIEETTQDAAWDDKFYVECYQYARADLTDHNIATLLGVEYPTFRKWKDHNPAFADALERGHSKEATMDSDEYLDYMEEILSDGSSLLLKEIRKSETTNNGYARMRAMVEQDGRRMRQQMFLHSFVALNFSFSAACRETGIHRSNIYWWMKHEPEFGKLVEEIPTASKKVTQDFIEGGLLKLIAEGDTAATIFASKTYNKDRGYSEKIDVDLKVSGTIEHKHVIPIEKLDLDFDTMVTLLEATRRFHVEHPDEKAEWVDSAMKALETNHGRI